MSQLLGYQGEEEFSDWLQEFGSDEWLIYENIWLYNGYRAEIDFLIISRTKWIMIEVKNYDGIVTLGESQSRLNDYSLDRNPIEQVQRSLGVLHRIASQLAFKQKVEGALVFINTHCKVDKIDSCFGIPIYSRVEIRNYIRNLVDETQGNYYTNYNLRLVMDLLAKHEDANPFEQVNLAECNFSNMYRGFTCGQCRSLNIEFSHRHIKCQNCKHVESKNQALVRMARDYCVLFQCDTFSVRDIYDFIGGKMRLDGISKILSKKLNRKSGYHRNSYVTKLKDID